VPDVLAHFGDAGTNLVTVQPYGTNFVTVQSYGQTVTKLLSVKMLFIFTLFPSGKEYVKMTLSQERRNSGDNQTD
jgi:hypothetical protein